MSTQIPDLGEWCRQDIHKETLTISIVPDMGLLTVEHYCKIL